MNTVTVKISGMEYNLKGEEREEYLHKVAAYVDRKIKDLMDNNHKLNLSSAAVLTAINAVDDLFKCDMAYKELCEEVEGLEQNNKELNKALEDMQAQLKHMGDYNQELQHKLEEQTKLENEKIAQITKELTITEETAQKHVAETVKLKHDNKELKFQLQTSKFKILELQNNLLESQVALAKSKKESGTPFKK